MKIATLIALSWLVSTHAALSAQGSMDIVVGDTTLVQRCVLAGPSSRMIAVGSPGGFNFAFDALHCAPVYVWKGGFLDFKGEGNARGGNGCKILGVKQSLGIDTVPFRVGQADSLPESLRFHGYRRDPKTGQPTFRFEVDGVPVEQTIRSPKPDVVALEFAFAEPGKAPRFYLLDPSPHLRIQLGKELRWSGSGIIEIPAHLTTATIAIHLKSNDQTFVREVETLTGEELFSSFCSACHSIDGTKLIGPTFKGLWGSEHPVVRDGETQTVTVDADYIRESINNPQAAIAQGYELVPMADFSAVLSKEQIESLIDYLQELE